MAGLEDAGLAPVRVFHAAPGSFFSAAQNSLSGLDSTEIAGRSNIFAGRLLPRRLPSKTNSVGLNPLMSLIRHSSAPSSAKAEYRAEGSQGQTG